MSSFPHSMRRFVLSIAFLSVPGLLHAQISVRALPDAQTDSKPQTVADWSRQVNALANAIWTESNTSTRQRELHTWAEQTPEHLTFVTRTLQKNDKSQTGHLIVALKDLFSLMKRVTWQPADHEYLQRVVAGWSVVVPQLVKQISSSDLSASQRRQLEMALTDLASLSRDLATGSPIARANWQAQVTGLGQLTRHSKASVRMVALNILEVLGSDAAAVRNTVHQSLQDADHFVRWYALRTIQSMGMDSESIQTIARLKNDDDSNVRQLVSMIMADPGKSPSAQLLASKAPLESTSQPALKATVPAASIEKPTVAISKMPATKPEAMPVKPAEIPASLPSIPLQTPVMKTPPASEPVPLFGPAPSARAIQNPSAAKTPVQQVSSMAQQRVEQTVNRVGQWLPKLKHGTVEQQLLAIQELAKMGESAGEAVPVLAELLLQSDVVVRREVPVALMKIGKPARLAVAMLERSLQDADTDVKVNAARALLELAE